MTKGSLANQFTQENHRCSIHSLCGSFYHTGHPCFLPARASVCPQDELGARNSISAPLCPSREQGQWGSWGGKAGRKGQWLASVTPPQSLHTALAKLAPVDERTLPG